MINRFKLVFYILFKGGDDMMAMFFAQRVILEKITFSKVPNKLKEAVREILIDSGLEFMIDEA